MTKKLWTIAGLLALVSASAAAAQNTVQRKVFTNRLSFSLPVRIDERDKAELRELKFYVKTMTGGRQGPGEWQCVETAPPTKNRFQYQAAQDGEYWFAFVTIDRAGRPTPTDLDKEAPGLIVVVDTRAPDIEVNKLTAASGEVYLQCQIRDSNPDYSKIKLEALMPDKSIRQLEALEDTPGIFRVSDPAALRGFVRATAMDKAGNKAMREVDLNPAPPPPTLALATAATSVPPAMSGVTQVSGTTMQRMEVAPPAQVLPPPGRQLVNSMHCSLDYALDTASVSRVEAYATRDGGRSWMRLGEDADRRSPFEFDLPEDGVYGITLVISTPARPGVVPVAGDTPDCWIEVDTMKPAVHVPDVRPGGADDPGQITITWSAQDKNLAPEPVEILIAGQPEGPWLPLARGQKPEGSGKFTLPRDIGWKVHLRVEARDLAGNCGRWESKEPIAVDGGKPKARVLGVNASPRK